MDLLSRLIKFAFLIVISFLLFASIFLLFIAIKVWISGLGDLADSSETTLMIFLAYVIANYLTFFVISEKIEEKEGEYLKKTNENF